MALTKLDRRSALIVVDLQYGIVSLPVVHSAHEIVERVAALAERFRGREFPVVLVNTNGSAPGRREQNAMGAARPLGWTDLVPELRPRIDDWRVTKQTPGAFTDTDLERRLKDAGITQVVVAGIATGTGVEMTARQAYELGFNVAVATDAMTDIDAAVHENSVIRVFPRIGETGSTAEITALLKGMEVV